MIQDRIFGANDLPVVADYQSSCVQPTSLGSSVDQGERQSEDLLPATLYRMSSLTLCTGSRTIFELS